MAVTILCVSSSADARRWRYYYYGRHTDQNAVTNQGEDNGSNASSGGSSSQGAGFAATMDQLIRGCSQEAVDLKNWPFDYLARIVAANEKQIDALQQMQKTVVDASDTLGSKCPKDVPAALSDRFDALKQGLEAFVAALDGVRPSVEMFYGALDDEQKARLVAIYISNNGVEKSDQVPLRRASKNAYPESLSTQQETICRKWAAALRSWPTHQIESSITLSDIQHAALYDLTASIFRAAGTLIASCPAEASFTPLGQIDAKRKRVDALAGAIGMIRPVLDRFTETLDDEQKMRLANTVSSTRTRPRPSPPPRRSDDDD